MRIISANQFFLAALIIPTTVTMCRIDAQAELPTLHLDIHAQPVIVAPVAAEAPASSQTPEAIAASKFHHINQHEIQVGQLARQRAELPAVRKYAEMLVEDHKAADSELEAAAKKMNLDLGAIQFDEKERAMMDHLQSLTGKDFDQEFISQMRNGHLNAIEEMKEAKSKLSSGELETLIGKTLPKLEEHAKQAGDLEKSLFPEAAAAITEKAVETK